MGRLIRWIAVLALLAAPIASARAQDKAGSKSMSSTILIFDGSGSMWGKLSGEKQAKFDEAREAVRTALGKLAPQSVQLGLMSFGHRRASDCNDVQLIVPPEGGAAADITERIMEPLDKLNPRGKGPLTVALREAAKVLAKLPPPRNIVMLHDDPDNCQADPCEALAELQKSAPGVVISIIGLGLKPEDAARYQCLTKPTGGRQFDAQNAAQISDGIGAAIQLAASAVVPPAPVAARRPPASNAPQVAVVEAAAAGIAKPVELLHTGPPALRLRALLVKDRIPLGHQVHWSIFAATAPDGSAPVAEADGIDAMIPVPPSAYRVHAAAGIVSSDTRVTVGAEGQTLAEVTFDAAELRLVAPLPGDATLIIARHEGDAKVAPEVKGPATPQRLVDRLGLWPPGQLSLLVPAQPLWLLLEQGELHARWPVEIAAGQARQLDVAPPGGRIAVGLVPRAGPPIDGAGPFASQPVVFTLEEDDPDAPHGRREIARTAGDHAEFVVPPNVYTIAATRGTLESRERISVAPGETVERSLPLLAARLVISAHLGAGEAAATGNARQDSFKISRLDSETDAPFIMAGSAIIADVPPGRYRIEARRNSAAIKAEQTVEVRTGDYRPIMLDYQAGELRLEIAPDVGTPDDPIFWRVSDGAGRVIWNGSDRTASTLLGAGRYAVQWVVRGQRREQAVDIRAGLVSTVRLVALQ